MNLFETVQQPSRLLHDPCVFVVIFQGAVHQPTFFMQYLDRVKQEFCDQFKMLDIQQPESVWKSQLSTSFLGMSCVYWLGDIAAAKPKQKEEFLLYLAEYQGPHKIICFVDSKTHIAAQKNIQIIALQDKYFYQDAKKLWVSADAQKAHAMSMFLHEVYKIKNSFSLDELFLLKKYQDLISHAPQEFYELWVQRLVVPDTSLFTLSQLLFEKKETEFFKLWFVIQPLYQDMFWVAFLSDQLYRAYFFIVFTQQSNFAAVKQVSFGLSFSFMKQTYKQYQLDELQRFHQAVYALDTALKSGSSSYVIDQLLVDFFAGKFIG